MSSSDRTAIAKLQGSENQTWKSTVNQRSITATHMAPWHGPNDSKHQGSQLQRHQSWDQWMPIVHALPCFPAQGGSQHERIEIVLAVTSLTRWMRATHGKDIDSCFRSPACKPTNPLQGPNNHCRQCKFVLVDKCPQQNLYAQHESSTRIHWQAHIFLMEKIVHQLTQSIAHDLLCCMQIYLNRYGGYQQVQDFVHQKYVSKIPVYCLCNFVAAPSDSHTRSVTLVNICAWPLHHESLGDLTYNQNWQMFDFQKERFLMGPS